MRNKLTCVFPVFFLSGATHQELSGAGHKSNIPREKAEFIVAIDGPAAAGKSTIAKLVAQKFSFLYLDTGAMYRALTLKALNKHVDLEDSKKLQLLMDETSIDLKYSPHSRDASAQQTPENSLRVFLDKEDVTRKIRLPEVTNNVFYVARDSIIRKKMVGLQRQLAKKHKKVVLEGRDIGTVVFPGADIKFFLDADIKERAKRRFKELEETGTEITLKQIEKDIVQRDKRDKTREVAPLKKANDAVYIDTTNLAIEKVFLKVSDVIKNVLQHS